MITKRNFVKINDWLWEIPKTFRDDMRVPARVYTSEKMLEDILGDRSVEQLIDGAVLPGILKYAIAMPDCHQGYSVPIGFVGAVDYPKGVISPGAVGFDISCGMRLLKSSHTDKEIMPYLDRLAEEIQRQVPSGLGRGRKIKLSIGEIDKILQGGAEYMVEKGYGEEQDIENCEEGGRMDEADSKIVSSHAKERGRDQVGTLGSGNHFLEVQKVEEIFMKDTAEKFGLFKNQAVIMIHTGSRGLGHQVCSDYLKIMIPAMAKYEIKMPNKEFACVPIDSAEGKQYFAAMKAASNYAWANRQMIAHSIREIWKKILGKDEKLEMLYDVSHNIAKIETYEINNEEKKVLVHRKGSTRAFPAGNPEIPEKYQQTGQPVLIPGSMGTASYVLVGTEKGKEAFHSTCHGSGRIMSRHQALKTISGREVVRQLEQREIVVKCHNIRGIAEEAPLAYKNIDNVVEVVQNAGLSQKVVRLVPLAVIKGE